MSINPQVTATTEAVIAVINRWHPERDVVGVNVVYTYVQHTGDPEHRDCRLEKSHFGGVVVEGAAERIAATQSLATATVESAKLLMVKAIGQPTPQSVEAVAEAHPDTAAEDQTDIPAPILALLKALDEARRGR